MPEVRGRETGRATGKREQGERRRERIKDEVVEGEVGYKREGRIGWHIREGVVAGGST